MSVALAAMAMIAAAALSAYFAREESVALSAQWVAQACWFGVAACAASVYLPAIALRRIAPLLALCAGLCAGVAVSGQGGGLLRSLPWLLLAWPAAWLIDRGAAIAIKVVCSWLLAIAVLAATLAWLPVTPGYLPDHLE